MAKIMIVEDDVQASLFVAEVVTMGGHTPIVVNESYGECHPAGCVHPGPDDAGARWVQTLQDVARHSAVRYGAYPDRDRSRRHR